MDNDWTAVSIETTAAGTEPVTGRLYRLGITGVEIEDDEVPLQGGEAGKCAAGKALIKAYLPESEEGHDTLAAIRESISELKSLDREGAFGSLAIQLKVVNEKDWADNWKQYFKPIKVGERVLIRPAWEELPPDSRERIVFSVDPGVSFGSGTHETTRLCVTALEKAVHKGDRILDLGSGTGILGIIGLLLGAGMAYEVDIDPEAARAARRNAGLNGIAEERLITLTGDITADAALRKRLSGGLYDIILANIVADVIIALAPFIGSLLEAGGAFICSGIISERREEVSGILRLNGIAVRETYEENGWVALVCGKAQDMEGR